MSLYKGLSIKQGLMAAFAWFHFLSFLSLTLFICMGSSFLFCSFFNFFYFIQIQTLSVQFNVLTNINSHTVNCIFRYTRGK